MKTDLSQAPTRVRSLSGRGLKKSDAPRVEREGGMFSAGLIRGVSVVTRGEALGHGYWLDGEFVDSVFSAMSERETGLKARFTHPGLSADGLGTQLGHLMDPQRVGDQVFADLHFQKASHATPDGDLAEYVMTLADENPQDFGLSIVFSPDWDAEDAFTTEHQESYTYQDSKGNDREGSRFRSPDPDNVQNLEHARLSKLWAADVVDEPAANPGGMFTRKQNAIAFEADAVAAFALGLEGAGKPTLQALSVHPDRVKEFAERFLEARGLTIVKKDEAMSKDTTKPADATKPEPTRAEFAAELKRYTTKFGGELGASYFGEGLSWADALEKFSAHQSEQLAAEKKRADEAQHQLSQVQLGETQPVEASGSDGKESGKKGFSKAVRLK